jgi:hypothetical protein
VNDKFRIVLTSILVALPISGAVLAGLLGYRPNRPQPQGVPPPPLVVETRNPKLGVHTRLTDEPEVARISRTLQLVREMGAPWIVELFPWAYIQPEPGRFDWEHADIVVAQARQQGLKIIARLDIVPAWARPEGSSTRYLDEAHYEDYARFAAAFAQRYRGRVEHIILWNEPNLAFEWGGRPPDPAAYVALLETTYPLVKVANPEAIVLTAGLAPNVEPLGSPGAWNDLLYLEAIYEAGGGSFFDALAAHTYGYRTPFSQRPDPARVNFRRVELLRVVMKRHGDEDKLIYVTEAGWNDHPRWIHAVRPAERISYTLEACRWAEEQDWLAVLAFWQFRLPWGGASALVYYNFVGLDFTPRPIYLEVQAYARGEE